MLVDWELKSLVRSGNLGITPFNEERVQPVSYDLALDGKIRVTDPYWDWEDPIDPAERVDGYMSLKDIPEAGFVLQPRQFILGCTVEKIRLAPNLAARVEGKSSLGRLGILIHSTAGFIDPGFEGQITLEIYNLNLRPVRLHFGMPIAQLCVDAVECPSRDYSQTGRYQGQTGPQESRYSLPG